MTMESRSELPAERAALARTGIGASEVAAVLGFDRFRTPFDLWLQKKHVGIIPPVDNAAAEYGHYAERTMLNWYADREGMAIYSGVSEYLQPVGRNPHFLDVRPASIQGPQPWMFCTPDGRVRPFGEGIAPSVVRGVECKRRNFRMMDGWGDEDQPETIPLDVAAQVHYSMACLNINEWHVVAELGGQPPRIYTIARDLELEGDLVGQVEAWVNRYLLGDEEPDKAGDYVNAYLTKKFTRVADVKVPATAEQEEWLAQLESVQQTIKALEAEEDGLKVLLKEAIGDRKTIESTLAPGRKAMWYPVKGRETVAWKKAFDFLESSALAYVKDEMSSRGFPQTPEDLAHFFTRHLRTAIEAATSTTEPSRTFRLYHAKEA